jgi:DNA-binding helix-hairpin-helix protein with protein kinase domain
LVRVARERPKALKWYYPHTATRSQRQAIEELIERRSPSPAFLWPQEVVSIDGRPGFGYLMPLRDERYAGLADLLNGKVDVPYSIVCTLAMLLADAFLSLHAEGLCYRDISFGNVFFDPHTGAPLVCDNDNVGVDGASPSGVLGTPRFMAPEIVRDEAAPSTTTDLFSLSVLLFYLLMVGHPLLGARELRFSALDDGVETDRILHGRQPIFIFDPVDVSNRPVADYHGPVSENWQLHPQFIKDLFTKAFGRGLIDPANGRVRESVWRAAAARLRDSIVVCSACLSENYFEPGVARARCWCCDQPIADPVRLVFPATTLVLNADTAVYRHHLVRNYDFTEAIARVTRRPEHSSWGLRNIGTETWRAHLPTGVDVDVAPQRSLSLVAGTIVDFGGAKATITA